MIQLVLYARLYACRGLYGLTAAHFEMIKPV